MADGPNIGYAALQIIPSFKGAEGALAQGIGGPSAKAGDQAASSFAGNFTKAIGAAGIGVGIAAAVGVGLFKIGDSFDEQFDKIRVGTGQTGAALEALQGDFKNVLTSVPTDFGAAGDAITGLTQKLDLQGKPLQERAEQFLELSRITGTDLKENLGAGTDALQAWGIQAKYQGPVLDELFRASQESGASFADLSSQLAENSVTFQALGFSVDDASTFLGGLAKGGIDAATVMPGLNKALAAGAKDGKSAKDVYEDLLTSIKGAPDATKAASIAYDVLGARAGPKFAQLVRSGKLSFDDLRNSIVDGTESIIDAGKDTQDFSEKFDLLKNRVLVGIEPLASGVFDAVGSGMDALGPVFDTAIGGIETLVSAFQTGGLSGLGDVLSHQIETAGPVLLDKLGDLIGVAAIWATDEGLPGLGNALKVLVPAVTGWISDDAIPAIEKELPGILKAIGDFGKDHLVPGLFGLGKDMATATLEGLNDAINAGGDLALDIGASLANGLIGYVNRDVIDKINDALEFDIKIHGVGVHIDAPDLGNIPLIKRAAGGPIFPNVPTLVGEDGPELYIPDGGGSIIPNHQLRLIPGGGEGVEPIARRGNREVHLHVVQYPGENQIDAGMRALRWNDTIEEFVGVAR